MMGDLVTPLLLFAVAIAFAFIAGVMLKEHWQAFPIFLALGGVITLGYFQSMFMYGIGTPITNSFKSVHMPVEEEFEVLHIQELPNKTFGVWAIREKTKDILAFRLTDPPPPCFRRTRKELLTSCEVRH